MSEVNMSATISPKSDQINADDFLSGPKTFTIKRVAGNEANKEQPVNIFMEEIALPYRPSKSMRRVLVAVLGADASKYVGHKLTLFNNPEIRFGGVQCGGIQISHMTGLEKSTTLMLTSSRSKKAPFVVKPLVEASPKQSPQAPATTPEQAQDAAREAAKLGRDSFQQWWKDNADLRDAVKPIMSELQKMVEEKESATDA